MCRSGWIGGALSITLASIYLAGTLALGVLAAADFLRRKRLRAREIALYTALVTPSIAALSLVAERSSYELFGFSLTVLSLTVAHFHFAGFAAALIACLVVGSASGQAATAAAISVPLGTGIVLLGFFLGDPVELLGAAVLTVGMWLVGWALWRRSREAADRIGRVLLTVSASVLVVTMLLRSRGRSGTWSTRRTCHWSGWWPRMAWPMRLALRCAGYWPGNG